MIGQFTFLDQSRQSHTAALSFDFRWVSSERDLRDSLNRQFPPTADDRGPIGNPGESLIRRAAAFYGGGDSVILFRKGLVMADSTSIIY